MSEPTTTKWYDKKGLVVLLCIVFFPVGLYALWMSRTIGKGWKIGVSVFFGLVVLSRIGDKEGGSSSNSEKMAQHAQLTQAQKDSIAMAEQARKEERAREAKEKAIEERRKATISAMDLCEAYSANEVRADENYKGKTIYVTGNVKGIEKGNGRILVILEGWPEDQVYTDVYCEVRDKSAASMLMKGQTITVRGVCRGRPQDLDIFSGAEMTGCEIVDELEN